MWRPYFCEQNYELLAAVHGSTNKAVRQSLYNAGMISAVQMQ